MASTRGGTARTCAWGADGGAPTSVARLSTTVVKLIIVVRLPLATVIAMVSMMVPATRFCLCGRGTRFCLCGRGAVIMPSVLYVVMATVARVLSPCRMGRGAVAMVTASGSTFGT